ncbi:MAG: haloacid dehalogenase [Mycobacterium sp.]|jgi:hypothetical protein|nr:haloacid dehalogenase [Mycobacterium sp.]
MFDYSGTLFRLDEDESWFAGMHGDDSAVDGVIFLAALSRLGVPAAEAVMIGDSEEADGGARDRLRLHPRRPTADRPATRRAARRVDRVRRPDMTGSATFKDGVREP